MAGWASGWILQWMLPIYMYDENRSKAGVGGRWRWVEWNLKTQHHSNIESTRSMSGVETDRESVHGTTENRYNDPGSKAVARRGIRIYLGLCSLPTCEAATGLTSPHSRPTLSTMSPDHVSELIL